ncbi:hypothetical protein MVES_003538 [Malassezia vespertilionis]|uniref:Transmembrane protein 188 n=1 Tax=Malassezia vespertilionis TaxID=2020962 RepID=A0A2N1J819_9BASI|nr:hypothetical protein MVES_003538 [Malassezia vespertilionis]
MASFVGSSSGVPGSPRTVDEFPPAANAAVFRDLLIFEERLKQNAARLGARKQKYQAFLYLLCTCILWAVYSLCYQPQDNVIIYYARLGLVSVCCTMVMLFFASGIYAGRITAANKFVPQANRSLRNFNMLLNRDTNSRFSAWLAWIPFWQRIAPRAPPPFFDKGPARTMRSKSPRAAFFRHNTASSIPQSGSSRGELVFSNRVTPHFREGYERYRGAFERKRKEKLALQQQNRPSWFWPFSSGKRDAPSSAEKQATRIAPVGEQP